MTILLVGHGERAVRKEEWRRAGSRADLRASVDPLDVPRSAPDGAEGERLVVVGPDGEVRHGTHRLRIDPFVVDVADETVRLALTGASLLGVPARSPRPLGRLEVGDCVEVAVNLRWQGHRAQTVYIDHVWRIQRVATATPGIYHWPAATRTIDLRVTLH